MNFVAFVLRLHVVGVWTVGGIRKCLDGFRSVPLKSYSYKAYNEPIPGPNPET